MVAFLLFLLAVCLLPLALFAAFALTAAIVGALLIVGMLAILFRPPARAVHSAPPALTDSTYWKGESQPIWTRWCYSGAVNSHNESEQ